MYCINESLKQWDVGKSFVTSCFFWANRASQVIYAKKHFVVTKPYK